MKIAALADIHGNYQALISILDHIERWNPDLVLVLGDIVNRGPRSRECLHLIQEKQSNAGWKIIKGNHEGYVLNFLDPDFPRSGWDFEFRQVIFWTYQSLSASERTYLKDLPESLRLTVGGNQLIRGLHASIAGDRVGIYPNSSAEELADLVDQNANLFLVGHTHQPLIKRHQDLLLANVGSVGLSFDGDKRAAYGQFMLNTSSWSGEIMRVEYDLAAAARDFYDSGFIIEGGPLANLILAELDLGWPQLSDWFQRYEFPVRRGEIDLTKAVDQYLENPNIEEIRDDIPMAYP